MVEVIPIQTPSLGDRSYVVSDGALAVVVDPQRDLDRVLAVTEERGLQVAAVAETHLHNDYVTGGLELARRFGADYLVAADARVDFLRRPVRDGDLVAFGAVRLGVRATPGHTPHHVSYVLEDDGGAVGVFTGGNLLYGATGRTDLVRPEVTEELTRLQYRSARALAAPLPDSARIYPTHGFGSFCSAGSSADRDMSTVGQERADNDVFQQSEDDFVAALLSAYDAFPAYYRRMGPLNAAGPGPADLALPPLLEADAVRHRIEAGQWVVDVRPHDEFLAAHRRGALSFGLDGSMATYVGWLVPWGDAVTLLGRDRDQLAEARRELVRIGYDEPAAALAALPDPADRAAIGTGTFGELVRRGREADLTVLDVRACSESDAGHVEGATLIPVYELPDRIGEVPPGEVWVHCATGYRATIAASLLTRAGRDAVVVVTEDWERAEAAGVRVTRPS